MAIEIAQVASLVSINASELFDGDNINWRYCNEHAPFPHRDACEFIMYCADEEDVNRRIEEMRAFGCTEAFITTYAAAHRMHATYVQFYAG